MLGALTQEGCLRVGPKVRTVRGGGGLDGSEGVGPGLSARTCEASVGLGTIGPPGPRPVRT